LAPLGPLLTSLCRRAFIGGIPKSLLFGMFLKPGILLFPASLLIPALPQLMVTDTATLILGCAINEAAPKTEML
jgi:hypothetical protein